MASHASALKAHRQNVGRRERNRELRARLRTALKTLRAVLDGSNLDEATRLAPTTVSLIDKLARKGIIHRNAAARHKSRISTRLSKLRAA